MQQGPDQIITRSNKRTKNRRFVTDGLASENRVNDATLYVGTLRVRCTHCSTCGKTTPWLAAGLQIYHHEMGDAERCQRRDLYSKGYESQSAPKKKKQNPNHFIVAPAQGLTFSRQSVKIRHETLDLNAGGLGQTLQYIHCIHPQYTREISSAPPAIEKKGSQRKQEKMEGRRTSPHEAKQKRVHSPSSYSFRMVDSSDKESTSLTRERARAHTQTQAREEETEGEASISEGDSRRPKDSNRPHQIEAQRRGKETQ